MRDDYLSAEWASGHHHVSDAIHKAIGMIAESFDRLHDHQFDAPWREQPKHRTGAGR